MAAADLCEVFTSIQGEGLFAGRRQLFVRFACCNLDCVYCDTKYARKQGVDARFENTPCSGTFYSERNPTPPFRLNDYIDLCFNLDSSIHSISFTGGEPLVQLEFVDFFMNTYKKDRKYHLETNGTLPAALENVVDRFDFISMDMKINYFGEPGFPETQAQFLKIAIRKPLQVKVVVEENTDPEFFARAVDTAAQISNDIPFIIQPETGRKVKPALLLALQKSASGKLKHVLVIPQMHPCLGIK